MTIPFVTPRARFFDSNGDPLAGGSVSFYEAGTSTLKAVYTDNTTDTPATNPHTLDSEGYVRDGGIWLDTDPYKIVVKDSADAEVWTMDNVPGDGVTTSAVVTYAVVDTIDELVALSAGEYSSVMVLGYYARGDEGGGLFQWDASDGSTDNGGTIIQPGSLPANGRWLRVLTGEITPHQFGAVPGTAGVGSQLAALATWANANDYKIRIPAGEYDASASVTFTGDLTVEIDEGAKFVSDSAVAGTITISSKDFEIHGSTAIVDFTYLKLVVNSEKSLRIRPDWYGAIGNGVADDGPVFVYLDGNTNGHVVEIVNDYLIDSAAGAITFTDPLYFRLGSSIEINSAAQIFTIPSYEADPGCADILKGGNSEYFRIGQGWTRAQHWLDTTVDATEYSNMIAAMTAGGTEQATIVWDDGKTYTIAADPGSGSTKFLYNDIRQGTLLKFTTANASIGSFPYEPRQIFDPTSTTYPLVDNQSIMAQWWGAKGDLAVTATMTANVVALEQAFGCLDASVSVTESGQKVCGMDTVFYVNSTVNATGDEVRLTRCNLVGNSLTGTEVLNIAGNASLDQVHIHVTTASKNGININTGTGTSRLHRCEISATSTAIVVTDAGTLVVSDCEIDAATGLTFDGESLTVIDSRLTSTTAHITCGNLTSYTINTNRLIGNGAPAAITVQGTDSNSTFCGNRTNRGIYALQASGNVSVVGNSFLDTQVVILDPRSVSVTGNTFTNTANTGTCQVALNGSSAGWVVYGTVITGNTFYGTSGTYDNVLIGPNIAASGHQATVKDNSVYGSGATITTKATEVTGSVAVDVTSAGTQDKTITLSNYILPNSTAPIDGYLTFGGIYLSGGGAAWPTPPGTKPTDAMGIVNYVIDLDESADVAALPDVHTRLDSTYAYAGSASGVTQEIRYFFKVSEA